MKKNLLVTLADKGYVDQAKQLFSSAYWNGKWEGDYMLFAYNIPEKKLKWFRDKGILIRKCKLIPYAKGLESIKWPPVVFCKFYLFTTELKKWKNVVYLDGDIIVRSSLNDLTKIKGLGARYCEKISEHFINPLISDEANINLYNSLKKNYDFNEYFFNSGVMAFSTDIIKKNTFYQLEKLSELYRAVNVYGEQPILNLLFYKKFKLLPNGLVYNFLDIDNMLHSGNKVKEAKDGTILHFNSRNKPWLPKNKFYEEWTINLIKANLINLKISIPDKNGAKYSTKYFLNSPQKKIMFFYIRMTRAISSFVDRGFNFIDASLGRIGIFLRKNFPRLYFKLKNIEKRS